DRPAFRALEYPVSVVRGEGRDSPAVGKTWVRQGQRHCVVVTEAILGIAHRLLRIGNLGLRLLTESAGGLFRAVLPCVQHDFWRGRIRAGCATRRASGCHRLLLLGGVIALALQSLLGRG